MPTAILSAAISVRLMPSRWLWGWCVLFSMAVCVSLWLSVHGLARWLGISMYVLSMGWQWTQWPATVWPHSVQWLQVDVHGQFHYRNTRGELWRCRVAVDSVVHPWLLALHLTQPQCIEAASHRHPSALTHRIALPGFISAWVHRQRPPQWLLLMPDHAETQALKALRVWLRWGRVS